MRRAGLSMMERLPRWQCDAEHGPTRPRGTGQGVVPANQSFARWSNFGGRKAGQQVGRSDGSEVRPRIRGEKLPLFHLSDILQGERSRQAFSFFFPNGTNACAS